MSDPQSRNEAILRSIIDGTQYTAPPRSRIEDLLLELKGAIESGELGFTAEVVDTLPSTGERNTIYLVPNSGTTPNIYDEYIYVDDTWEKIGTTEIDMTQYYTKTEADALLADKANTATTLSGYGITDAYTSTEVNTLLSTKADADAVTTKVSTAQAHILTPTGEGKGFVKHIYGMSEQNGTPTPSDPVVIEDSLGNFKAINKNLNSYPYYNTSTTINDVTFTVNSDGSITVNGKASANATFVLHTRASGETNDLVVNNGTYIFSGCPSGGSTSTFYIQLARTFNSAFESLGEEMGNGLTVTLDGDDYSPDSVNIQIIIVVRSGVTLTNATFYPMLRPVGTDNTFVSYTAQTITTGITLRAIEVTSSDAYNLEYDGKYYIADSIDFVDGTGYVLTQRIDSIASYNSETLPGYWMSSMEEYESGTTPTVGASVIYALATPTTSTLTTAQTTALLGLVTYDEATNITPTAEPYPVSVLEYGESRVASLALSNHNEIEILKL